MATHTYKAMTPKEVMTAMQLSRGCLTPIIKTPDCRTLLRALSEIHEGAKQNRCDCVLNDYAFVTLPMPLYKILYGKIVNPPQNPGELPTFDDNISNAANSCCSNAFFCAKQLYDILNNVNTTFIIL